jgi:uncharacterized RDD family membrane protein YckC
MAYVLDLLVCYGSIAALGLLLAIALLGAGAAAGDLKQLGGAFGGVMLLLLFAAQWIYFVAWEGWLGRSPGKMAFGLRVLSTAGRPIGLRAAALRNLLRAADALPTAYLLGVASMALSPRFQRLGDLVAGTMVVVPERARAARALELRPPAQPMEVAALPDEVSLDPDERSAIELFLRRRHTLGRAREAELAEVIAGPIGARLAFSHPDPSRLLALVYDRAVNAGRTEAPPSSWRPQPKKDAA